MDGAAIAAELAPIKADTMHDTMLDDLLVMNFLPKRAIEKQLSPRAGGGRGACSLVEVRVVMMKLCDIRVAGHGQLGPGRLCGCKSVAERAQRAQPGLVGLPAAD